MDALNTICSHQSIRRFTGEAISEEQLQHIYDAVVHASSSCFMQFVTTIRIHNKERLAKLAQFSGGQSHIAECSDFLMFCLDLTKLMHFTNLKPPFSFKMLFMGLNDCSIVCQNAFIAAEAQGLGGVIIGGYKHDIEGVSELLQLPVGVVPLVGLCLGVPDKEYLEEQKPRLPRSWLFMDESFHDAWNDDELKQYDADMERYYANRRYNCKDGVTWTKSVDAMLQGQLQTSEIIAYLKKQGFDITK